MGNQERALQVAHDFEPLLTQETVAARLGRAPVTLRRWRAEGTGPDYVKVGGAVRYRWTDVEAWLTAHTFRNAS